MPDVSIRDLRNHGGEIVERASRGEVLTITRSGKRVAELRPLPSAPLSSATLLRRWRALPPLDPAALRRDLAEALDDRL